MSLITQTNPVVPPPRNQAMRNLVLADTGDGRIYVGPGRVVVCASPVMYFDLKAQTTAWRVPVQTGWVWLRITTSVSGAPSAVEVAAGTALPADTRHRLEYTNGPADAGQAGDYYLPLARLLPGIIDPILGSGSGPLVWSPPTPEAATTDIP